MKNVELVKDLSIRDYLISSVLIGITSRTSWGGWTAEEYAKSACEIADAVLKEREAKT